MFQPYDIRWIKNITRDKGAKRAYMEFEVGDVFELNFSKNPKWYPTNYLKPKPNELIALFQTLISDKNQKEGCYVTHLVIAVDNELSIVNNPNHPYVRLVCVVGKAIINNPINANEWSFYKCNRGQICNIKTIERRIKTDFSIDEKQKFIWSLYNHLSDGLDEKLGLLQNEALDLDVISVTEGIERTILKLHKIRERDPGIVASVKSLAKKENRFFCEVCSFNFENVYPSIGNGFIECHHKQPISIGGIRQTTVNDLALVCANCHRMLHRKNENGEYFTLAQLKEILNLK